jgi:hypothetical protein
MSFAVSPRIRKVTSSSARRVRIQIEDHRMVTKAAHHRCRVLAYAQVSD